MTIRNYERSTHIQQVMVKSQCKKCKRSLDVILHIDTRYMKIRQYEGCTMDYYSTVWCEVCWQKGITEEHRDSGLVLVKHPDGTGGFYRKPSI